MEVKLADSNTGLPLHCDFCSSASELPWSSYHSGYNRHAPAWGPKILNFLPNNAFSLKSTTFFSLLACCFSSDYTYRQWAISFPGRAKSLKTLSFHSLTSHPTRFNWCLSSILLSCLSSIEHVVHLLGDLIKGITCKRSSKTKPLGSSIENLRTLECSSCQNISTRKLKYHLLLRFINENEHHKLTSHDSYIKWHVQRMM
jgi:hypothetical protein